MRSRSEHGEVHLGSAPAALVPHEAAVQRVVDVVGLGHVHGMVYEDNREIGEGALNNIERKMLSDKGAKEILGGLKDEYCIALVAFANMV